METKTLPYLKWSYTLFGIVVVLVLLTTLILDSALASVPTAIQRIMSIVLIVLPAFAGAILGALSFTQKPRRWLLSILFTLLNGLTGAFFLFVVLIAG